MANIKSAKKRMIQSKKHRKHNAGLKSKYRTAIKKIIAAITNKKKEAAKKVFKESVSILDKVVLKKVLHKNKAARYKSRLNAKIKKLS